MPYGVQRNKLENRGQHSDRLLVQELIAGNEKAFHSLFETHQNDVFTYSRSFLKSDVYADEIVQEVFMKVWLKRETLNSSLSFKAYLMTITKNMTLNFLKKATYDEKLREEVYYGRPEFSNPIYDEIREKELEVIKQEALELLPPKRRLIFELARNEGMSYEDISQALGISRNTVKSQMRKALETLRNFLSNQRDLNINLLILTMEWLG